MSALEGLVCHAFEQSPRVAAVRDCEAERLGEGSYLLNLDIDLRPIGVTETVARTHTGAEARTLQHQYEPRGVPIPLPVVSVNLDVPKQEPPVVNVNIDDTPVNATVEFKRNPDGSIKSATIVEEPAA